MGACSELQRLGVGLGIWVWLPVLALLILIAVIGATPSADCDGFADDLSGGEGLAVIVAAMVSLGALGAAASRVVALRRGVGIDPLQTLAAAGALVGLVVLSTLIDLGDGVDYLWALGFAGVLATAATLLALVVAWTMRRKPDEVGLLLPLYLLGAALFVYPGFALTAIAFKSGAFC